MQSHLTLSGSTKEQGQSGSTALSGVTISAYRSSDNMMIATATSDATGKDSLAIDATPLDGYLKATKSGYTDTYVYPAAPWGQDATLETSLLSTGTFGLLVTFAGGDSKQGRGHRDPVGRGGQPGDGRQGHEHAGLGRRNNSDGTGAPTSTTGTPADGTAFFLSVPIGNVTVNATKSGATFKPHAVAAHSGALVTTVITE